MKKYIELGKLQDILNLRLPPLEFSNEVKDNAVTKSDILSEFMERLKAERTTLYYKFDDEVLDVEAVFWDDVKFILAEMEGE